MGTERKKLSTTCTENKRLCCSIVRSMEPERDALVLKRVRQISSPAPGGTQQKSGFFGKPAKLLAVDEFFCLGGTLISPSENFPR